MAGDRRDLSEKQERVWLRLGKAAAGRRFADSGGRRFWRQSVTVPLPAAVAAAALLVAAFTLALANYAARKPAPVADTFAAGGISLDVQEIVPVSDMNSFLQYLESEDSTDFMIIRLPETRSFSNPGQPTMIKASDYPNNYSRSSPRR
jgi:hypothetical protein